MRRGIERKLLKMAIYFFSTSNSYIHHTDNLEEQKHQVLPLTLLFLKYSYCFKQVHSWGEGRKA